MKKLIVFMGLLIISCTGLAADLQGQSTAQGLRYFVGGVGLDERALMDRQFGHYSLRVEVAEKGGAYTTGVGIRIADAQGRPVLEAMMEGPVLLVDLPAGQYQIDATQGMQQQSRKVSVAAGRQTKITFLWSPMGAP